MNKLVPIIAAILGFSFAWAALTTADSKPPATTSKPASQPTPKNFGFRDQVSVERKGDTLIVKSNGLADHKTGDFPNRDNPNRIQKQNYTFYIPLNPKKSDKITKTPMGPIGVAINGVPFYNPYTAEGEDAAKNEVFDECCGHPDQAGRYHYHIYPKCVKTPFSEKPGEHSPLIGYMFDGYAIYGPNGDNGKPPTDLDECNGHTDSTRGYHYHVTDKFPYIIGGYRGVVDPKNLDRPRRGGGGDTPDGRPVGPMRRPRGDGPPPPPPR